MGKRTKKIFPRVGHYLRFSTVVFSGRARHLVEKTLHAFLQSRGLFKESYREVHCVFPLHPNGFLNIDAMCRNLQHF